MADFFLYEKLVCQNVIHTPVTITIHFMNHYDIFYYDENSQHCSRALLPAYFKRLYFDKNVNDFITRNLFNDAAWRYWHNAVFNQLDGGLQTFQGFIFLLFDILCMPTCEVNILNLSGMISDRNKHNCSRFYFQFFIKNVEQKIFKKLCSLNQVSYSGANTYLNS